VPELPDVEGYRRNLASSLARPPDTRRRRARRRRAAQHHTADAGQAPEGPRFTDPRRHGKWLILPTEGPRCWCTATSRPYYAADDEPEQGLERLVIGLDRGQLRYVDLRKLRGVWLAADDDVRRLHSAMKQVLRTSVRHGRVPSLPRWLTRVRDDPDPTCPRCGARLMRGRIGGRTSVWCPRCQPS
jgi:formamidopyrimidine-DNA glycosylase